MPECPFTFRAYRSALTCATLAALLACFAPLAGHAAEPSRIVAVGGAVSETLYAIGADDRIAGVDSTSLYPPQAQAKPNVGYMRALSAEGVLALSPDLILIEDGSGPPDALALMKASGVPVVSVPSGHGAEELAEKIETVAKAVGKDAAGEALAQTVEAKLARLQAELAKLPAHKRVLFVLSVVDGQARGAGTDTAADAMIRLAGGDNVLAGVKGYKALSAEAAATLAPDVIVMMTGAGPQHDADPFAVPALKATPAGKAGALIRMDGAYLLGFGPRTADAARDFAAKLYPSAIESAP
ncbi:ABC transporter substrate-binding protein [Aurantimonas sp. MSK8Z-1]|uniref:heme/hemin ABC transporter substrate-binding protein n=1 Tax=Mangrovibrevibacter kandeliae TaxID=2968473 RepID=UPI002117E06C|nr:ABC transporter substrate-binding protein [Aurantimonas sp. MSK8Z-1]MCW4114351.1 ABC transporter substrate-binding protein [Aurantimonas sp. MSK8Z-1]